MKHSGSKKQQINTEGLFVGGDCDFPSTHVVVLGQRGGCCPLRHWLESRRENWGDEAQSNRNSVGTLWTACSPPSRWHLSSDLAGEKIQGKHSRGKEGSKELVGKQSFQGGGKEGKPGKTGGEVTGHEVRG